MPVTPPDPKGHLDALDGLRAVAILLVVSTHVAVLTGMGGLDGIGWRMTLNGGVGVPIFFILSGALLYRPWARSVITGRSARPSVRTYFWHRGLRVLPAYWVMLPVGLLVFNAGKVPQGRWPSTWLEFLTLMQSVDPRPWWTGAGPRALGPIWSLSVEASFYLVLPLLAGLLDRYARRGADRDARFRRLLSGIGLLGLSSLSSTIAVRYSENIDVLSYNEHLLTRSFLYFALGMGLVVVAEAAKADPRGAPARWARTIGASPGLGWVLAICGLALVATPLATPAFPGQPQTANQYLVNILLFPLIAVALVSPALLRPEQPLTLAVLANPVMRRLGVVSYGMFLWHMIVIEAWYSVTDRALFQQDFWLVLVVALVGAVTLAELNHRLIELPSARFRGRVAEKQPDRHQHQALGQ
ncbi:MAG: acyltransferase [Streptosporangiaceae bacterium]